MKALVFCEHHEGALTRGALGLLSKAAQIVEFLAEKRLV